MMLWFYIFKTLNQARLDASFLMDEQLEITRKWLSPYTLTSRFFLSISLFHYMYHLLWWVALGAIPVVILPILLKSCVAICNFMLDINVLMIVSGN